VRVTTVCHHPSTIPRVRSSLLRHSVVPRAYDSFDDMAIVSVTTATAAAGVLILVVAAGAAAAAGARRHHVVGGDPGWAVASDVLAWSADRLFTVGDTLWFAYSAEDGGVAEVGGEEEFESCDAGSPVRMYTEGLSRVDLGGEGSRYFVSADPDKCGGGLKLRVDVRAPVAGTTPPPGSSRKGDRAAAPAPAPLASSGGRGVATSRTCVMLCCLLFLAI
uniref:Phytocyanin domain-containing protein n=1 Tax=Oryza glaberrima TaxID=4538 RepID=I1P3P1_ORYGL